MGDNEHSQEICYSTERYWDKRIEMRIEDQPRQENINQEVKNPRQKKGLHYNITHI